MRRLYYAELAVRRGLRQVIDFAFLNLVSIGVVATSMLLVGMFVLLLVNLSAVMDRWGRDVQIYAYLADGISEDTCFRVKEEIEAREEVARVHYVSPEQALETFRRLIPDADRLLADLEHNPLPASLEIRLQPSLREPEAVARFASSLEQPAFVELDYAGEWVSRFYTFLNLLKLSGVAMGTLLALACLVIVGNTIQLTTWARRNEIEILQLVGATDRFIAAPYLLEGAFQGCAGALLSGGLLAAIYRLLFVQLQDALGLTVGATVLRFLPPYALLLLVLCGLLLGLAGSWLALRRVMERPG